MNLGGDAAEQVVKLSLEGMEIAVRLSGAGAKNMAVLLAAVLKEEHKTKGKTRLTSMLKSGRPLKVFSITNEDLGKFAGEARRYGVLYCVLKDKENKEAKSTVDIIARADDAPKIQRIMERLEMGTVRESNITREEDSPFVLRAEKENPSEKKYERQTNTREEFFDEGERPSLRERLADCKQRVELAKDVRREKERIPLRGGRDFEEKR